MSVSACRIRALSALFRKPTFLAALASIVLCSTGAWAQLPVAQLSSVFPAGGKAGTTFDVTITGADLDESPTLHFSHPGITAKAKTFQLDGMSKSRLVPNQYTVTIAGDVPSGLYEARSVGRFGISNPRAFQVGKRNEARETKPNDQLTKASPLTLETTLNGKADASAANFFRFAAKKGQRVLVDCWSQRIDSKLNAVLRVTNAAGRELAHAAEAARRDPFLDFTAAEDGDYFLEVHDLMYRGGDDFFYRLDLHTGPHIDFVFPPAGLSGTKGEYTLYGRNLPGGVATKTLALDGRPLDQLKVQIEIPADAAAKGQLPILGEVQPQDASLDGIAYRYSGPGGDSNAVTIGLATAPVVLEQEPNDDPAKAQKLTVPCEVAGQFNPRGDQDWYQFDAKKGDVLWIEVISERLGLTTDPFLTIQRVEEKDGKTKISDNVDVDDQNHPGQQFDDPTNVVNFDTSTADPIHKLVVNQDATYRVLVRELNYQSRGSAQFVYRLSIRRATPDFRLIAIADPPHDERDQVRQRAWTPLLQKGGSTLLKVYAFRRDEFNGDIELSVEGLPAGVKCPPTVIGSGCNVAALVLSADDTAASWGGTIKIVGKAKIGDADVAHEARGGGLVWSVLKQDVEPHQVRMMGDIAMAVTSQETAGIFIDAGEKVWETSLGGKLDIPIKVTRRPEVKGPLPLDVTTFFQNMKPASVTIPPDKTEGVFKFEAKQGIKPGTYEFAIYSPTQVDYRRDPEGAKLATEYSKEMDQVATKTAAEAKAAADAMKAAAKAVADATAALKAANDKLKAATPPATGQNPPDAAAIEAKSAGEKAVAEATEKLKTANDAKAAAEKMANDMTAKTKAAEAEKAFASKRAKDMTGAANSKNVRVTYVSTPITIKIASSPVVLPPVAAPRAMKPGEKLEVPVAVNRLYGFEDAVEIELIPPQSVSGIRAAKLVVAKGKTEGNLVVQTDAKCTTGELQLPLKAKMTFNGQSLAAEQTLTLKVEPAEPAK